jgi:hypothetical protein
MQLMQQMNNAMQTGQQAPQLSGPPIPQYNYNPPAPAYVPAPQSQPQPRVPEIDLAVQNPEEYNKQLAAYLEARAQVNNEAVLAQVQQLAAPLMRNNAMMARNTVAGNPEYQDIFSRYGPEVDLLLQQQGVPLHNRTIEAFEMAAQIIRGRHFKELAKAEAQKIVTQPSAGGGTVTGGTAPTGDFTPSGDALDIFWETDHDFVRSARSNKLTKSDLRTAIKQTGHTAESYVKMLDSNDMFIAPDGKHITMRGKTNA